MLLPKRCKRTSIKRTHKKGNKEYLLIHEKNDTITIEEATILNPRFDI